jgi:hypothetical protein
MAVDDEVTAERSEGVYETKITLVGEAELESTISFLRPCVQRTEPFLTSSRLERAVRRHRLHLHLCPFSITYSCM